MIVVEQLLLVSQLFRLHDDALLVQQSLVRLAAALVRQTVVLAAPVD